MFKQLNDQDVSTHIKIVGWLLIGTHLVLLLIAGFLFLLLTGVGAVSGDAEAMGILSVVGTLVGGFLGVLSLPGILAGIGVLGHHVWGRYLAILVGFLNVFNFPVGTLIGLYAIWVLLQESANNYFAPPLVPRLA